MIRAETWERAHERRQVLKHADFDGFRTDFIDSPGASRPAPQALFVELVPGWVLRTHYHLQHQFQVVTAGTGRLGRHELRPFAIHYASPESGYGPIVVGPQGLSYFALRAVSEEGGFFLPEARARMRIGLPKQQLTVAARVLSDDGTLRALSEAMVESLIAPQPGGLAAWLMRVPADATVPSPVHGASAGRFYVVAGGAMRANGGLQPVLSTIWVPVEDEPLSVSAGPDGLEVLVLQFPADALAQ